MSWQEYKKKRKENNNITSEDNTNKSKSSWQTFKESRQKTTTSSDDKDSIIKLPVKEKSDKSSFKNTINLIDYFNSFKNASKRGNEDSNSNFKNTVSLMKRFNQTKNNNEEIQKEDSNTIKLPTTEEERNKQIQEVKNKLQETNERQAEENKTKKPVPIHKKISNKVEEVVDSADNILQNFAIGGLEVIPNSSEYITSANKTISKNAANSVTSKILGIDSDSEASQLMSNVLSEEISKADHHQQFNDNVLNSEEAKNWRNETIQKNIEEATGLGKYLAEQAPSIGNNLFNMAVSAINPAVGTASFITSAAGSYLEDARNMGMSEEQSLMYGTIMGAVEGGTEAIISGKMLEHGASLLGVNGAKKVALHKIVNSFGFDIAENFAQEALTEPINETVKYVVGGDEYADFSNMGERMLKSGIDGAISSIILGGASVGINSAIKLSENISNGKSVSQSQIKKVVEDCKNAGIPVNDILAESIKENTNALSQTINENNAAQIQGLQEEISKKHKEWKQSTDAREKQIIQETINNLNNELQNITIQNQTGQTQQQTQANNTYLESARRYNIDTNNQTVKAIDQVTSQRGIQTRFDGDVFTNSSANALWRTSTDSNGNTVREVILNPNVDINNKTLQNIIVHELTHDIEGSKEYSELKDLIINYDKNNIDYESARKALEEIYSKVYDKNSSEFKTLVENEAVADILGSKLGDQEFITNLTTEKPSIAKRIYNWVVDKLNKINKLTGYKNEKLFWNDVKNKFENAYRQDYQRENSAKNKYSIQKDEKGNTYIKIDTDQKVFEGIDKKDYNKIAKMYIQDYLIGTTQLSNDDTAIIDSRSVKKYTNPQQRTSYMSEKMQLTPELKNVLKIAKKDSVSLPTKENSKYRSWEYYKFNFELDGKMFDAIINIGIDKSGNKHFYEINKIHFTGISSVSTNSQHKVDLINNSISSSNKDVNTTRYSIQDSKDNTKTFLMQDNQGRILSKKQQDYFKNVSSELVDDGKLKRVYHTTTNAEEQFNIFDPRKTDFYRFGNQIVNYYTDSKKMSGSYADGSYEMAETSKNIKNTKKAKRQYEGYINIINPYIIDAEGNNWNQIKNEVNEYGKKLLNEIDVLEKNNIYNKLKQIYDDVERTSRDASDRFYKIQKKAGFEQYHILGEYARWGNIDNIYENGLFNDQGKAAIANHINDTIGGKTLREIGLDLFNNKYETLLNKEINKLKEKYPVIKTFPLEDLDIIAEHYEEGKKYIENRYRNRVTTNDIVKKVIDMNKNGARYDGVIIKNVVDYGGGEVENYNPANVYVTFNSNQFKNIDNINPTDNPDIRYSQNNQTWQSYLNKNYKNTGTGETIQDVKINQNSNESSFILPVNNQSNNINLPTNNSQNNELSDAAKEFSSPTIDYIKDKRSKNRSSFKEIKDTLAQKFVNKGHYVDKLAKETGNKNLTYLYDRTMNTFNEAQISIGEKQINSKGEVVGKSIIDIFEPAEKAKLSREFQDYLLNKHNVSRYAHEKGIYGNEISATDSSKTVAEYEKIHPEFKEWAEEVSKYNDNNLKDLVDNGLIAASTYKKLKELYPDYVPTYRDIVDNISQYEDDRVGSNILKRATQSDRKILSVSESMAEQTLAIKKAIRINNLGIELYKTLGKNSEIFGGIQYDTYAIETLGGDVIEKAENGDNIFTIFVNGNMTQFRISDELYSAFAKDTLQNRINNSKVTKTLLTPVEKLTRAQRELLTTYNIGFAFTNPMKDFQDALVNTKYSQARFMKNYVKALYNLSTKGSYYESYKNNGGMANTYFDYDKGILPTSSRNPLKKFVDKIKNVNEILEQAPRIAEYISTIEKGGSIDEALYNAADITTNFKRGGDIAKVFNKYGANFLNASIQGLDKIYRNISGQNGARGYFNLLVKATLASVGPAILNHLLLGDDDDYEDLQDYVKDNYYLFKTGEGTFFRIPKGRISSVLGGLARRVMETGKGDEVDWASLVETVSNSFAPNNPLDDNLFAPLKQASENKTWYGTDLVPSRLQDLPPAEQYDETTDKFSIWLGEKLNISPYKINYILDQYSGGIGDVVLPMLTQQAEGNSDSIGGKLLAPLTDKFTTDSVMKNKNVSKFYSLAEEINVSSNSSKATDEQILQNKYLNTIKSEMSDLYKEKREIQAGDLPDSEKYEQAREIQQQINDLAELGLANYENVNISGDYAEVNGTEYQKEDGNWKKIDDDKSEKLDQMDMTTKEKNEYLQFESSLDDISSKYKEQSDSLNENSSTYEEDKSRISSEKKTEIINTIINSGLSDEKKLNLFEDYYSSNTVETAYKAGIDIDSCLSYEIQTFTADKDANGKTISGSKKNKVINYVNSLNLSIPQKAILIKSNNSFKFNDYNNEIVDYVSNLNLTYYEKKELLEELDMKVLDDGTVTWE